MVTTPPASATSWYCLRDPCPGQDLAANPGWHQGLRLLVIAYALLPLVFLALFSSSRALAVPGFAYSLYIAPLWAIAFWLLVRPGR